MRMSPTVLTAVLVASLSCKCTGATAPSSNADAGDVNATRNRTTTFPAGWGGGTATPNTYQVGIERAHPHSGNAAAFLSSSVPGAAGFVTLSQALKADPYRGKRIRWHGWVRFSGIVSYAGLWMRIDGPGLLQAFDNMYGTRQLQGTSGWREAEVVLDVPDNAIGIALGVLMTGQGDLVVDDLTLEQVSYTTPSTDQLTGPQPNGSDSAAVAANYSRSGVIPANLNFEGNGLAALISASRGIRKP